MIKRGKLKRSIQLSREEVISTAELAPAQELAKRLDIDIDLASRLKNSNLVFWPNGLGSMIDCSRDDTTAWNAALIKGYLCAARCWMGDGWNGISYVAFPFMEKFRPRTRMPSPPVKKAKFSTEEESAGCGWVMPPGWHRVGEAVLDLPGKPTIKYGQRSNCSYIEKRKRGHQRFVDYRQTRLEERARKSISPAPEIREETLVSELLGGLQ